MYVLNKEQGGYISLIHTLSDSIDGCEMNRKPLPMLPIAKDIYANIPSVSKVLLPDKLDQPME